MGRGQIHRTHNSFRARFWTGGMQAGRLTETQLTGFDGKKQIPGQGLVIHPNQTIENPIEAILKP